MTYLHAKISEVESPEFQALIDELYHCVGWQRDDRQLPTVWLLLNSISRQDPKALTAAHLPTKGIATTKIDKLPPGVIYDLCRELADLKHTHIESLDGKAVLSLLKVSAPKPARQRKPSRGEMRHDAMTRLIEQRRRNGDL